MRILFRWLVTAVIILMLPSLISGITVDGLGPAFAAAAVLSVFNILVKPILVLLTLPLTFFSLGFFLLVINAFLLEMVGHFVQGFHVESFVPAFFGALIVSLVSWVTHFSFPRQDGRRVVVIRKFDSASRRAASHQNEETVELEQGPDGKWS